MTIILLIAFGLMCFLVLNGYEQILNELNQIKDRQDTLYTTVLGKINGMANSNTKIAKTVNQMNQTYFDCMQDQIVILQHIAEILDDAADEKPEETE